MGLAPLPHPDLPASGARDRCPTGPLAPDQPTSLSPHAAEILTQRSLTFSLGASLSYPLSIDPPRTWRGLAFCASFGLLLIGTARALSRDSAFGLSGAFAVLGAALAVVGIVQKATFNGKIYGFWELVRGGAPFGAHGSIGIVRARPESADRLVALFTSKRPFLCRRCGWRARRDWTDQALRKLTNYGAGGAEPDPLLASLDILKRYRRSTRSSSLEPHRSHNIRPSRVEILLESANGSSHPSCLAIHDGRRKDGLA